MEALEARIKALEDRVSALEQGYVLACGQYKVPTPIHMPVAEVEISEIDGDITEQDKPN